MDAAHIVAEFVGEGVGAGGIDAAHDAEAVAGEVRGDGLHDVAEAGVGGHGFGEEADEVGAVLVAPGVDGVHVAVGGALEAAEVGAGVAGLGVGHFAAEDEVQRDGDEAVREGGVGLGNGEVDGGVHADDAAGPGPGGGGVGDHDIDDGIGDGIGQDGRNGTGMKASVSKRGTGNFDERSRLGADHGLGLLLVHLEGFDFGGSLFDRAAGGNAGFVEFDDFVEAAAVVADLVHTEAGHVDGGGHHFALGHEDDLALRPAINDADGNEVGAIAIDRILEGGGEEDVVEEIKFEPGGVEVQIRRRGLVQGRVAGDQGGGVDAQEAGATGARLGGGAVAEGEVFRAEHQGARAALGAGGRGSEQERDAQRGQQPGSGGLAAAPWGRGVERTGKGVGLFHKFNGAWGRWAAEQGGKGAGGRRSSMGRPGGPKAPNSVPAWLPSV